MNAERVYRNSEDKTNHAVLNLRAYLEGWIDSEEYMYRADLIRYQRDQREDS